MALVIAWPLQTFTGFEPRITHSRVYRTQRPNLIPNLLRIGFAPIVAHAARNLEKDGDVVSRTCRRFDGFSHALDTAFAVRHGAIGLAPCRTGGQDHIRKFRRLRQENVLSDDEIETLQKMARMILVRFRLQRVFADHI